MRCPWQGGAERKFRKTVELTNQSNLSCLDLIVPLNFSVVFFPRFPGCQRLADYLEGVKKNYEATAQILKHNCETHGHGESCYKLGAYYVAGKGKVNYCVPYAKQGFVWM